MTSSSKETFRFSICKPYQIYHIRCLPGQMHLLDNGRMGAFLPVRFGNKGKEKQPDAPVFPYAFSYFFINDVGNCCSEGKVHAILP